MLSIQSKYFTSKEQDTKTHDSKHGNSGGYFEVVDGDITFPYVNKKGRCLVDRLIHFCIRGSESGPILVTLYHSFPWLNLQLSAHRVTGTSFGFC